MNNKSFISEVANRTGMDPEDAQMFSYTLVDVIMVSPNTKKRMLVPPKLVLSFKPSSTIKEKIKNGGLQ